MISGTGVPGRTPAVGADAGTLEIGVLLLVPEPLAGRVSDLRARLRDPRGAVIPPHVTLVPPTRIDARVLDDVVEHLEEVAATRAPFEVRLRGTRTFQPVTDVVYLAVVAGGADCDALQAVVRRGPLNVELRFPYHPHVTLAHDVPQPALDAAVEAMAEVDVTFPVREFVLYAHRPDAPWQIVRTFTLQG